MQKILRDERGAAVVLELVVVGLVLTLIGVAVYQSHNTTKQASVAPKAPSTLAAETTATQAQLDATNEAALSAEADSATTEADAADSDVSNLGGSFDASSF